MKSGRGDFYNINTNLDCLDSRNNNDVIAFDANSEYSRRVGG